MIKLIGVLAILILAPNACAFEISSTHPGPGETVNPYWQCKSRRRGQVSIQFSDELAGRIGQI